MMVFVSSTPVKLVSPQQAGVIADLGSLSCHACQQKAGAQIGNEQP